MKKSLRILGMALVASALFFTACGDKDDDNNDNNNQQQQQQQDDDQASMSLIFGDEAASLGTYQAVIDDSQNPYLFAIAAAGVDAEGKATLPQFQIGFQFDTTAADDHKWTINYLMYSDNAEHYEAVKPNAEWVYQTINAFQFTKFTTDPVMMSFDADVTMQSYYEYAIENVAEEDVTTKQMLLRMKNIHFANGTLRN